jgi:hypothetical protein
VGRHAVEEPAVVADDDRAAGELEERLLERAQRVDVEIVRRLVEEEHVARRSSAAWRGGRGSLAAGEVADLLLLVGPLEVEPRHVGARIDLALPSRIFVLAAGDLLPDRLLGVEALARLVDVRELDGLADRSVPPSGFSCP